MRYNAIKSMQILLIMIPAAAMFLVLDLLWFYFSGNFVKSEIGSIARLTKDGLWEIRYAPALLVYLLLGLGISTLVFPLSIDLWRAIVIGAVFGLVTYGIYDLTNLATLSAWTIRLAIVDILWGAFVCATVSGSIYLLAKTVT